MITLMCKNRLQPLCNEAKVDNNAYLAQIITSENAELGPDHNFTASIHIYIYVQICMPESYFEGNFLGDLEN